MATDNTKLYKYGYDISMEFIYDNKTVSIMRERILTIVTGREYVSSTKIMPSIYVTILVDTALYNKIIDRMDDAKFLLKILKYNYNSSTVSKKRYINEQFDYIASVDAYSVGSTNDTSEIKKDDLRRITLGLYRKAAINNNELYNINGIFPNTNTISIIHNYTSHMNMLIEKFDDNDNKPLISIPVISTINKLLKYINDEVSSLYNSDYIYFVDVDRTYLLSTRGKFTDGKDSSHGTFKINIQDLDGDNKSGGMLINNKMYIVNVDASNVDIKRAQITKAKINNVSTISPSGTIRTVKISSGKKNTFLRLSHDNPNYVNQIAENITRQDTTLVITKNDLDTSVFTPNKEYNVVAKSTLSGVKGKYQLISKGEVFIPDSEKFICTTTLYLQKVTS